MATQISLDAIVGNPTPREKWQAFWSLWRLVNSQPMYSHAHSCFLMMLEGDYAKFHAMVVGAGVDWMEHPHSFILRGILSPYGTLAEFKRNKRRFGGAMRKRDVVQMLGHEDMTADNERR